LIEHQKTDNFDKIEMKTTLKIHKLEKSRQEHNSKSGLQ